MQAKQKKHLQRLIVYVLIAVFVAGTFLLYLPLGETEPPPTTPPLDQAPINGQNIPPQVPPPAGP